MSYVSSVPCGCTCKYRWVTGQPDWERIPRPDCPRDHGEDDVLLHAMQGEGRLAGDLVQEPGSVRDMREDRGVQQPARREAAPAGRHNHVTREVRQDGSCPACVYTLEKMKELMEK